MSDLATELGELEKAQLVRRAPDDEPAFLFKHSLTQEATYQALLLKNRREIHREVARAYEKLYAGRLDEVAALLAGHYSASGDDPSTLKYASLAGDLDARRYANLEGAAHYSLALKAAAATHTPIPIVQDLYLKRGRALELLSDFGGAAANYEEMHEAAVGSGDRSFYLASLTARAAIRAIPGSARNPEMARTLANEALRLAHELGDRAAEARIHWILLLTNIYWGGNSEDGIRHGEQALAISRELGLREQAAFSIQDLSTAYLYRGDMEKAIGTRREAAELWRALDNKPMLAESVGGMGVLFFLFAQYGRALEAADEGYRISREIGNLGGQGFMGLIAALAHTQRGEFAQALKSLDDARVIADLGGLEGNGISVLGLEGWIYANAGDTERARADLLRALASPSAQFSQQRLYLYALSMRIELFAGNVQQAERMFREGLVKTGEENFDSLYPPVAHIPHLAVAELLLGQNEFEKATGTLDELLEFMERRHTVADRAVALWHKGQALAGLKRDGEAYVLWDQARALAEANGERLALWRILATMADAQRAGGKPDEADRLQARAREIMMYLRDSLPQENRSSFELVPEMARLNSQGAAVSRESLAPEGNPSSFHN